MENTNTSLDNTDTEANIDTLLDGKTDDEMLDMFVDQLIKDKNLSISDPDVLAELKKDLRERLINIINQNIIDNLPDSKLNELDQLLDSENVTADAINQIVEDSAINIADIVEKTMLAFRDVYLNGLDESKTPLTEA